MISMGGFYRSGRCKFRDQQGLLKEGEPHGGDLWSVHRDRGKR